jgi:alanine racemase
VASAGSARVRAPDPRCRPRAGGLWTHFAASEEDELGTREQLARLLAARDALAAEGIAASMLHAANSAATLLYPEAHLDLVRPGAAVYGIDPGGGIGPRAGCARAHLPLVGHDGQAPARRRAPLLRLAIRPRARFDRRDRAGRYGTVILARSVAAPSPHPGLRHRVAGTVTMDQLLVDCGDAEVEAGDEVVLIGAQGVERITAEELAGHIGTIGYEIVTAISERVPREYVG